MAVTTSVSDFVRGSKNVNTLKIGFNTDITKSNNGIKGATISARILFNLSIEALNLSRIEELKNKYPHASIGYEGRCEDIYPDCAVVFKNIDYVEKYLGDEEEFNTAVLTHQKFYDFFINMNQLEVANG